MISRIHEKLGTAGLIVAVVALVAALSGAAVAAVGLNPKQKKEVAKIAKKEAKKLIPAATPGPPGATGPAGANGTNGTNGAPGTPGAPGVSPTGTQFSGEQGPCTEGGVEFKGANTTFACNGAPGPTSTKLPPGETSKGLWQFQTEGSGAAYMSFSFPLQVLPEPDYRWIGVGKPPTDECPGTAANPQAEPSYLCIYATSIAGAASFPNPLIGAIDRSTGWRGDFSVPGDVAAFGLGSWAVTAACPKDEEGNEVEC